MVHRLSVSMPRVETPETDGEAQSECDVVAEDDDGGGRSVNLQVSSRHQR